MSQSFTSLSPAAASFLAVAQRQTDIEKKLAGLPANAATADARARMESKPVAGEIKPPAAQTRAQTLATVTAYVREEIGALLDALQDLPPDADGKRFHITIKPASNYGSDIRIICRYDDKPRSRTPLTHGRIAPVIAITAALPSLHTPQERLAWQVHDYTHLVRLRDTHSYNRPHMTTPRQICKHTAQVASAIARAVARMTPARIHDIARAMDCAKPVLLPKTRTLAHAPSYIRKPF